MSWINIGGKSEEKFYLQIFQILLHFANKKLLLIDDISDLLSLGVPELPWHPQILADQLTLSQPGGADYARHITTGTRRFSDLPTALQEDLASIYYMYHVEHEACNSTTVCMLEFIHFMFYNHLHVGKSTKLKPEHFVVIYRKKFRLHFSTRVVFFYCGKN